MMFHTQSLCLHLLTSLLLMNLFLIPKIVANTSGNETDRLALLKFKESVASKPHGFLNSWNDSSHFCSWSGVSCGTRHQRVTALDLSSQDFHGTISPYIGNLSFLRSINLSHNSFSGKIPQQVGHLFRLQNLSLRNNTLEGEIPVNLTFCRELRRVNLAFNRLSGKIPSEIGSVRKLENLSLSRNKLTRRIPPSLGNLSSIGILNLGDNNLVGEVPEEMGRLRSLHELVIQANSLSGTIPLSLFNISSMKIFSVAGNKFVGSIPPSIGITMPNLQEIYLDVNQLSGQLPASISNASHLELIDAGYNKFEGKVSINFENLPELQILSLSENKLGRSAADDLGFISSLKNCSKLQSLGLATNNFGGVLPQSIANLSSQLTRIYLGDNQISGTIPAAFENLNNLIVLTLHNNQFTGVIPTSFGKFRKLQLLTLHGNRLSGKIPSSIGNITQLYALYLSANKLEGNIPPSLGNLKMLQKLYISNNSLTGDIPSEVIGLSSLLYLDISQNSLTGSLPMEVGKLKIINMDISKNNLTGEIPRSIGDCQNLVFLDLHGNHFQGFIPPSFASLKGLEYLDLSRNNLSGQIPQEVQRLRFLEYLNLSFNNLEGEVPKEGVFQNTSGISLGGNTKLCGGVSALSLPPCPLKLSQHKMMHGFNLKLTISLIAGCSLISAFLFALYWRRKSQKTPLSADTSIELLPKVTYRTLYQATRGFSPSNLIGSGGFGSVYKGILDEEENNIVAIKVLNLQQRGASKSFTAECNALRNIRHRNLVKILTCCSSTDYNGNEFQALVFEYMSNGSLEEWLHAETQSRSLTLLQRLNISVDVASALCYLHHHCEESVIHRDLKPNNILLDNEMIAHLGDFGLAKLMSIARDSTSCQSNTTGIKGTIGYAAPEYAIGAEPSRQGDVYSYGILVLQMFTGRRPTDEMFKDGLNLHNFVKMAIPGTLMQILDPALLANVDATALAASEIEVNHISNGHDSEIEAEEREEENMEYESLDNIYVSKCILPVLKMGVSCSEESPKNRMSMEDVVLSLHHIQNAFISIKASRERRPGRRWRRVGRQLQPHLPADQ